MGRSGPAKWVSPILRSPNRLSIPGDRCPNGEHREPISGSKRGQGTPPDEMVAQFPMRRYWILPVWLGMVCSWMVLAETFGTRSRAELEAEFLADLNETADGACQSFKYQTPVVPNPHFPIQNLERVQHEYDLLGFDCVEVHRGIGRDLTESGIGYGYSLDHPTEVHVARFERRKYATSPA